jgi:hypothetical protein
VSYHRCSERSCIAEDKTDDVKDSFYKELEHLFNKLLKYENFVRRDFNAKIGSEDIFKLTIGNEILHKISNNNGVRLVACATSKNLTVKSMIFPLGRFQKGKPTIRLTIFL